MTYRRGVVRRMIGRLRGYVIVWRQSRVIASRHATPTILARSPRTAVRLSKSQVARVCR